MATKIETLKKPNGDQVLPRTRAKAVSMENGTTVEAAIGNINAAIDVLTNKTVQPDYAQNDSTQPDYIKNKPDENDAIEIISELYLTPPITVTNNGEIYTNKNGEIYVL